MRQMHPSRSQKVKQYLFLMVIRWLPISNDATPGIPDSGSDAVTHCGAAASGRVPRTRGFSRTRTLRRQQLSIISTEAVRGPAPLSPSPLLSILAAALSRSSDERNETELSTRGGGAGRVTKELEQPPAAAVRLAGLGPAWRCPALPSSGSAPARLRPSSGSAPAQLRLSSRSAPSSPAPGCEVRLPFTAVRQEQGRPVGVQSP